MKSLRTPDDRFTDLPDFPWTPRYVDVADGDGGVQEDVGPELARVVVDLVAAT
jgi:hypothetical protein